MKDGYRLKFLRWLVRDFFQVPLGNILPRGLMFVQAVLFPIDFFCWTQQTLKYDYSRDCLWIDGVYYDRFLFPQGLKEGMKIEIIKEKREYDTETFITWKDIK